MGQDGVIVAGAVIPICFWFLDSVAYYYQVKLRGVMNGIRDRIHQRHAEGYPLKEIGMAFGGISYVGVSSAIARVRQRLENNPLFARLVSEIQKKLKGAVID